MLGASEDTGVEHICGLNRENGRSFCKAGELSRSLQTSPMTGQGAT